MKSRITHLIATLITALALLGGLSMQAHAGAIAIEIPLSAFGTSQASGAANLSEVPDYIPTMPLRLISSVEKPTRLYAGAIRPLTIRHEVTRAL